MTKMTMTHFETSSVASATAWLRELYPTPHRRSSMIHTLLHNSGHRIYLGTEVSNRQAVGKTKVSQLPSSSLGQEHYHRYMLLLLLLLTGSVDANNTMVTSLAHPINDWPTRQHDICLCFFAGSQAFTLPQQRRIPTSRFGLESTSKGHQSQKKGGHMVIHMT